MKTARGYECSATRASRWTDIHDSIKNLLREHPALVVSALYVAASIVGMFYAWAFLREFGINVFYYAQISDFLVASLKEPFTWALVLFAVLLVAGDNAMSRRFGRKPRSKWTAWYGSRRYRQVNNVVALYIVFAFLYLYASAQARDIRAGEGRRVDVLFADSGAATSAVLLGTTGQFAFLFDEDAGRVDVHPFENVHSISSRIPDDD